MQVLRTPFRTSHEGVGFSRFHHMVWTAMRILILDILRGRVGNTLRLSCDIITYVSPHGTEYSEERFCFYTFCQNQDRRSRVGNTLRLCDIICKYSEPHGMGNWVSWFHHVVQMREGSDLRHFAKTKAEGAEWGIHLSFTENIN